MASVATGQSGRGWARTSLIIGLFGVGIWILIRLVGSSVSLSNVPNWAFIVVFPVGGPIGVLSGVVGVFRGRGRIRLMAIAGVVLSLVMTLFGLGALAFSHSNIQF